MSQQTLRSDHKSQGSTKLRVNAVELRGWLVAELQEYLGRIQLLLNALSIEVERGDQAKRDSLVERLDTAFAATEAIKSVLTEME